MVSVEPPPRISDCCIALPVAANNSGLGLESASTKMIQSLGPPDGCIPGSGDLVLGFKNHPRPGVS